MEGRFLFVNIETKPARPSVVTAPTAETLPVSASSCPTFHRTGAGPSWGSHPSVLRTLRTTSRGAGRKRGGGRAARLPEAPRPGGLPNRARWPEQQGLRKRGPGRGHLSRTLTGAFVAGSCLEAA